MNAAPIGLYDSGLGGLSVVREVLRQLPSESVLYLGDTARLPYGGRSTEELVRFNREILAYLASQGAKAILVACNTSCATALDKLRPRSPVPVLGLIESGARAAACLGPRVAVLATTATVRSGAYTRALLAANPALDIVELACPALVPAVESGLWAGPDAEAIVREQLASLNHERLDAAILGCTHFPLMAAAIGRVLGPSVALVDPAAEAVRELAVWLAETGQRAPGEIPLHRYVVTGDPATFAHGARQILDGPLPPVGTVTLQTLAGPLRLTAL